MRWSFKIGHAGSTRGWGIESTPPLQFVDVKIVEPRSDVNLSGKGVLNEHIRSLVKR
jgi:hypothetical protein